MDEYLSEKEQIEQIRQWWSDYGWYLVGGVAIGLVGLFGYRQYQFGVDTAAENAAAQYSVLAAAVADDDRAAVERALSTLRSEYAGSPYADNAELLYARMVLVSDTDEAIAALRGVMNDSRDAELAMIARLRLARVLAWQERYDEALELLDVLDAGGFAARMEDIRGDILAARGEDPEAARRAWERALVSEGADALDRNFIQIKRNNLSVSSASAVAEPAQVLPEVSLDGIGSEEADEETGVVPQADAAGPDDAAVAAEDEVTP